MFPKCLNVVGLCLLHRNLMSVSQQPSLAMRPATEADYPPLLSYLPTAQSSRWTFTQGLVVGQVSMVVIALLLIRYVIFEDSATALEKERLMRLKISERRSKRHAKILLQDARRAAGSTGAHKTRQLRDRRGGPQRASSATISMFANILERTGYDISTHMAESADWLNVMFAQAIAGYREDVLAGGSNHSGASHLEPQKERTARDLMEEILNRATSSFLDPIRVTEADFGDAYPIFTNARVRPADDTGRTRIEIDVDYSDQITLAIDTKLLVNFPKPRFAVLPVSLSLTVVRFSGTLAIELFSSDPTATVLPTSASPPIMARSRHQLHFSLHPDFALEASATSLLGSRAKLQDIPKIEQLLISRLRGWILDRFVWPRYWSLTLPNLVPSPNASSQADDGSAATKLAREAGQMKVESGIEQPDDSVIQPGHTESMRQERGSFARNSQAGSPRMAKSPLGSVEAWRAHAAGHHPSSSTHMRSTSDAHLDDSSAASFRDPASVSGVGLTSSETGMRNRLVH